LRRRGVEGNGVGSKEKAIQREKLRSENLKWFQLSAFNFLLFPSGAGSREKTGNGNSATKNAEIAKKIHGFHEFRASSIG
jgi:hypothetical protein